MNLPQVSGKKWLDDLINVALAEDIGSGDITTNAIIDNTRKASAIWIAKQEGVVAGLEVAKFVFKKLDLNIEWSPSVEEGSYVKSGELLVKIKGNCRAVLTAERTALNIAQRMSGIATKTKRLVHEMKDFPTKILDTRKTVPGMRRLDKISVRLGGGSNHRMGLFDLAMIKDNHVLAAGGIISAVQRVRFQQPSIRIEVEVTTIKQVEEALMAGADIIMLDNMSPDQMSEAVKLIGAKAKTEASGNITDSNIRLVASKGVNFISIGALTHSVQAFDISQKLKEIF